MFPVCSFVLDQMPHFGRFAGQAKSALKSTISLLVCRLVDGIPGRPSPPLPVSEKRISSLQLHHQQLEKFAARRLWSLCNRLTDEIEGRLSISLAFHVPCVLCNLEEFPDTEIATPHRPKFMPLVEASPIGEVASDHQSRECRVQWQSAEAGQGNEEIARPSRREGPGDVGFEELCVASGDLIPEQRRVSGAGCHLRF